MIRLVIILAFLAFTALSASAQLNIDGETYAEANIRTQKMLDNLVALDAAFIPAAASLRSKFGADSLNTHTFCPDVRYLNDMLIKMEAITKNAMNIVKAGKLKGYPDTEESVRGVFTIMLKKRVYDLSPFIQWNCKLTATDPYWVAAADSVPRYKQDLLLAKYYAMDTEIETLDRDVVAAQKDATVLAAKPLENKDYLCKIYKEIADDTEEISTINAALQQLNAKLNMTEIDQRISEIKAYLVKVRFLVATEKYRYKCD